MSIWKQESAQHKLEQKEHIGIEDEPRTPGKRKKKPCDWFVVYFRSHSYWFLNESDHPPVIGVWGEYRSEAIARAALGRTNRFYRQYICHRSVYELMKPLWKNKK